MTQNTKSRQRRSRGRAWYWKQTDSWYFTPPRTKRRVRLLDDKGHPVRGERNQPDAELALARVKADGEWQPEADASPAQTIRVADVCAGYIETCRNRVDQSAMHPEHGDAVVRYLNDLCEYCGGLTTVELKKGHVQHWLDSHPTWKSPVTRRNALTIVMAAFNCAAEELSIRNPLIGMEKPPQRPRLLSFSPDDEQQLYLATDQCFGEFLFACIHTGLRPYCELARMTVGHVLETDRGMQWRVESSKTGKTRVIPVRREVAELTRRRIEDVGPNSEAVLFCSSRGAAWKRGAGGQRFRRIREVLQWNDDPLRKQYSSYICRHTFAHRMLAGYWNDGQGCSIEVLAELMGDTPKVAFDHYGREWGQHYQEPLWAALGL